MRPVLASVLAVAALGFWHPAKAPVDRQSSSPTTLAAVLQALSQAAPTIHSVSANADVADYTALVDDTTRSSGMLYFQREKQGPMYALDLTAPRDAAKRLIYRDNTAYVYTPASKQVMKYALGDKQSLVNQFLLLGIGSTGADLTNAFQVALDGSPTLDGVPTVELTLTPRDPTAATKVAKIDLWYDTRTWIAAQQQIWQRGGDYHLVHFTHVKRNVSLSPAVFSTDFPGATVITPHS